VLFRAAAALLTLAKDVSYVIDAAGYNGDT
jgi:hypothetical protein